MASVATQIQKPQSASSQHDHIVSDGEDQVIHLRTDDVDFHAFQAPKRAKSISSSKWPMFPTIGLYFFFFMRSKVTMLKLHVEEAKMSISDTSVAKSRQTQLVDVCLVARLTTIGYHVATFNRQTQLTDVCPKLHCES